MKRAISVSETEARNFFRVYDAALMDQAVLAWCKVFGSEREKLHWKKLFPCDQQASVLTKLKQEVPDPDDLSKSIRKYRDTFVAHHDTDEGKRANRHPMLDPLRSTGLVVYRQLYERLDGLKRADGLPHPDTIAAGKLKEIERQWKEIADAARAAIARMAKSTF